MTLLPKVPRVPEASWMMLPGTFLLVRFSCASPLTAMHLGQCARCLQHLLLLQRKEIVTVTAVTAAAAAAAAAAAPAAALVQGNSRPGAALCTPPVLPLQTRQSSA
jgi:hypothetical protein